MTHHIANVLRFFSFDHLPKHLQEVSKPFSDLAHQVANRADNPETTVALRKLLEAKDAAVRAAMSETVDESAQRGAKGLKEPE